jgi:hypothetical protein
MKVLVNITHQIVINCILLEKNMSTLFDICKMTNIGIIEEIRSVDQF